MSPEKFTKACEARLNSAEGVWETYEEYSRTIERIAAYFNSEDKQITGGIRTRLEKDF